MLRFSAALYETAHLALKPGELLFGILKVARDPLVFSVSPAFVGNERFLSAFALFNRPALHRDVVFRADDIRFRGISLISCGFALKEIPEGFRFRLLFVELNPAGSSCSLASQALNFLGAHGLKIPRTLEVFLRFLQMRFGFPPALLIKRDACGFLKVVSELLRLRGRKASDHVLRDDRIASRAETRAEEDFLYVAPSHLLMVDVVGRKALARHHAADGELLILPPGALHGMV